VEISDIKPGEVRLDVNGFPRRIGVAADAAGGWGLDMAHGRRARAEPPLRWFVCPLIAPASESQREPHTAPQIATHGSLDTECQ